MTGAYSTLCHPVWFTCTCVWVSMACVLDGSKCSISLKTYANSLFYQVLFCIAKIYTKKERREGKKEFSIFCFECVWTMAIFSQVLAISVILALPKFVWYSVRLFISKVSLFVRARFMYVCHIIHSSNNAAFMSFSNVLIKHFSKLIIYVYLNL